MDKHPRCYGTHFLSSNDIKVHIFLSSIIRLRIIHNPRHILSWVHAPSHEPIRCGPWSEFKMIAFIWKLLLSLHITFEFCNELDLDNADYQRNQPRRGGARTHPTHANCKSMHMNSHVLVILFDQLPCLYRSSNKGFTWAPWWPSCLRLTIAHLPKRIPCNQRGSHVHDQVVAVANKITAQTSSSTTERPALLRDHLITKSIIQHMSNSLAINSSNRRSQNQLFWMSQPPSPCPSPRPILPDRQYTTTRESTLHKKKIRSLNQNS